MTGIEVEFTPQSHSWFRIRGSYVQIQWSPILTGVFPQLHKGNADVLP